MADKKQIEEVLRKLDQFPRGDEVSIIRLSETISASAAQPPNQRTSDVSNSSLDAPTPASLEADLAHYKELFAKLRFSYVEQVTKEKFIRAIVGDPPVIVTPQENLELEKRNLAAKAELKKMKVDVLDMLADLETNGRQLSQRYEHVQQQIAQLRELPAKIDELEAQIDELRAAQHANASDPEMGLPLAKTLALVDERRARAAELDRQLEQLEARLLPRKRKELDRLRAETAPLEARRANSQAAAREAKRRKEAALGGVQDDLEERGRWWRASEAALRQMLEVEA